MPNKLFNNPHESGPSGGKVNSDAHPEASVPVKNISWPGLPGKKQPKNRSRGVRKVKIHTVSKGI